MSIKKTWWYCLALLHRCSTNFLVYWKRETSTDISIPFFANFLLPLRSFWTPGLTLFRKEMKAVEGRVTVKVRDSANETFCEWNIFLHAHLFNSSSLLLQFPPLPLDVMLSFVKKNSVVLLWTKECLRGSN